MLCAINIAQTQDTCHTLLDDLPFRIAQRRCYIRNTKENDERCVNHHRKHNTHISQLSWSGLYIYIYIYIHHVVIFMQSCNRHTSQPARFALSTTSVHYIYRVTILYIRQYINHINIQNYMINNVDIALIWYGHCDKILQRYNNTSYI